MIGPMSSNDERNTERKRLLAKYKIVPSRLIPLDATEDHLRIVADMLIGFESQQLGSHGLYRAFGIFCSLYDKFAERLPTEIVDRRGRLRIACGAGCNHCCVTPVTVIGHEVLTIAEFIRATFSDEQKSSLATRIESYRQPLDEKGSADSMCPLNEQGLCSIYQARPFNCRRFHSFDMRACERYFRDRIEPSDRLEEPYRADRFGVFWQSFDVASTALGLDTSDLEFIPALRIALSLPDAAQRTLEGVRLFDEVKRQPSP